MLLPALANAKAKAKGFQCLNNHRQVAIAGAMYRGENDGLFVMLWRKPVMASDRPTAQRLVPNPNAVWWLDMLQSYIPSGAKSFDCSALRVPALQALGGSASSNLLGVAMNHAEI